MKRWERWTFGVLVLASSMTGLVYFWMKYLLVSDDPFAVVNHPWQAAMVAVHIVVSPPLILMFGIILNSHILKRLRATAVPNRKSGLFSLGTFFVMVASGYLLQVETGEGTLQALVAIHVTSGILFSVVYAVHLAINVRVARAQVARLAA